MSNEHVANKYVSQCGPTYLLVGHMADALSMIRTQLSHSKFKDKARCISHV